MACLLLVRLLQLIMLVFPGFCCFFDLEMQKPNPAARLGKAFPGFILMMMMMRHCMGLASCRQLDGGTGCN